MDVNLFDFYEKCLVPLTPAASVTRLLKVLMGGGETTEDFAGVLALDAEMQHWVRLTVQRLGFDKRAAKLSQMVILLGQNRIRDVLIGRQIERSFVKPEESLLGKLNAEREKAKAKEKSAPAKAKKDDKPAEAEMEIIPNLGDFAKYLDYAIRSEEIAVSIRNSYPGQAFAGGVIFDYVKAYLKSLEMPKLNEPALRNLNAYIEEVFKDGVRSGIAANEIIQKISIPHQKNVFVTALVHNVGKALMLAYDPAGFEKAFLASTGEKDGRKKVTSSEAEFLEFNFDHAQMGSLFIGRLPFLSEIERSVDYHHAPHLLRFSNPKLYALACVISVSNSLAKIYQRARAENTDTDLISDRKLKTSEEFAFLKLTDQDWSEIKANFALKLMKAGY